MNARRRAEFLLAALCLVGVLLLIAPLPVGARAAFVLPLALVAPGVAVTRTLGVRDGVLEVVLAFPISAALLVFTAQAALYLHAWSPAAGMVVLLAGSGALLWRAGIAPRTRDISGHVEPPHVSDGEVLLGSHLGIFTLAEELGNVSAACRAMGIDRSTYYRWKRRLVTLSDGSERTPSEHHNDACELGERVELDCFYLGRLGSTEGVVWQYSAVDVASGFVWAEVHSSQRNPRARWTRALVQRVVRDLKAAGSPLQEVSTDNGPEFRSREFSDAVERLGARHRVVKAGPPTGVQGVQLTIVEECWCPVFACSPDPSVTALQRELDDYLRALNAEHGHNGRLTNGGLKYAAF
jgi:Integrase core domain